jgi:alpha-mannosidase
LAITNGEVPPLKIGKPADFFDRLLEITDAGRTLPSWRGELYLEFHRGVSCRLIEEIVADLGQTYTTQANVKKGNRTMERLLRDLEYIATLASIQDKTYKYPRYSLTQLESGAQLTVN